MGCSCIRNLSPVFLQAGLCLVVLIHSVHSFLGTSIPVCSRYPLKHFSGAGFSLPACRHAFARALCHSEVCRAN